MHIPFPNIKEHLQNQILFKFFLFTCFKHVDSLNIYPTLFQYLMDPLNMLDNMLKSSNLCLKQVNM